MYEGEGSVFVGRGVDGVLEILRGVSVMLEEILDLCTAEDAVDVDEDIEFQGGFLNVFVGIDCDWIGIGHGVKPWVKRKGARRGARMERGVRIERGSAR